MDKSTFQRLIQTPDTISSNEALLLEELIEAFPYCQTAHLLLAKESKQKKSMNYPKKLKRASTYLLDRKILHRSILSIAMETANNLPSPNITEIIEEATPIPENKISISEEIEKTIQKARESRKQVDSILSKIQEEKPKATQTLLVDKIEESTFFKTESRLGDELHISTKEQNASSNVELFLAYLNQNTLFNESKKQEDKNSIIQEEVIKRFLEKEPKITRQIPTSIIAENANDLSKKSSELKNELVTENFAQILVKQNKIEKAKEVYKKLMLKYPDKSAYFGAKLNELENK